MACSFHHTAPALVAAALAALAVAGPAAADERTLYRSELPDGGVAYGDAPAAGARAVTKLAVEPHVADPVAASRAHAALQQQRSATLRAFELRQARIAEIDRMLADAVAAREAASRAQQQASVERDGDRQGRRLTAQYARREADAAASAEAAARRVSALQQAKAALQP